MRGKRICVDVNNVSFVLVGCFHSTAHSWKPRSPFIVRNEKSKLDALSKINRADC